MDQTERTNDCTQLKIYAQRKLKEQWKKEKEKENQSYGRYKMLASSQDGKKKDNCWMEREKAAAKLLNETRKNVLA